MDFIKNSDLDLYILIGVGVLIVAAILFFVLRKKQPKTKDYDLEAILSLLDKKNIVDVNYIRNKIVINFKDVTLFNSEQLHEKGALGINIIGDKIKFYFDGGNDRNEYIYNQIKKYIER